MSVNFFNGKETIKVGAFIETKIKEENNERSYGIMISDHSGITYSVSGIKRQISDDE